LFDVQRHKYNNPSDFAVFGMMVLLTGLIFSPFLLSVGMWLLGVAAIWHQFLNTAFERWNTMVPMPRLFWFSCKRIWRNYTSQPIYWLLSLLFLIPAASGIWSEEHTFWLTNSRVRIPFVTLALTFASLPQLNERQIRVLVQFFLALIVLTCMGVGINYLSHQSEILELIKVGKPIPVPRSHIRFSLSVAFAVLLAFSVLFQSKTNTKAEKQADDTDEAAAPVISKKSRVVAAICFIFLFLFIHFLSVRSGIMAMYMGVFTYLLHLAISKQRWGLLFSALLLLGTGGYVAMRAMPSLATKLGYMRYDYKQLATNTGGSYSDAGRLASIEAGWLLVKEQMWLGVGTGDLPKAVSEKTLAKYPQFKGQEKLPHNQWLFVWASTGLLGLLATLFAVLYWLRYAKLRKNALFVGFQAIALTSLLVEYTFETSIGAAFYLFNYCLLVAVCGRTR
jgi:O-antigen ligase